MVRNMASMSTLWDDSDMNKLTRDSRQHHIDHNTPHQTAIPKLVHLDARAAPMVQLGGSDTYTKDLMTRLAMGSATTAERQAFEARVCEARAAAAGETSQAGSILPTAAASTNQPKIQTFEEEAFARLMGSGKADSTSKQQWELEDAAGRLAPVEHDISSSPFVKRPSKKQFVQTGNGTAPSKSTNFYDLLGATDRMNLNKEPTELKKATRQNAAAYTKPFCEFLTQNPTVFHCVAAMKKQLLDAGFKGLNERDAWKIKPSGKYFVERNGSSLIAFVVGAGYEAGNGAAILAGHVDALTAKLKPVSAVPNKAGYLQLGVAPYAGGLGPTWWDRDLGIGGRVLVKEGNKIVTKLVKLDWPIAKIPTLAPHFGAPASGPFNLETNMVPIIGLEGTSTHAGTYSSAEPFSQPPLLGSLAGPVGSFVHTQPPALVRAIAKELGLTAATAHEIVNWELELFDIQPATVGGLDKEFIFAGRIDDKLCSWAALQALIETQPAHTEDSSIIKVVGLFDDEEIGSLLRQGARGNFLPSTIERAVSSLTDDKPSPDLIGRTYANSFLVSSDVTHAVNPNFLNVYLENHAPHLNVGVVVSADSNGHMTTDSVSTAILQRCADKVDAKLQVFQIRNDSRSGGTVGPMLSSATGIRAIDAGIPQLSMHSIRATTGALDPGLGVIMFAGFLNGFEAVDKEFRA
nr:vacuolar aminopeptidase 1 [Quercus suber]